MCGVEGPTSLVSQAMTWVNQCPKHKQCFIGATKTSGQRALRVQGEEVHENDAG
jgi:hypothetical protein